MSRWVQHISGQGKKYELRDNGWNWADNPSWETRNPSWFHLPRSEYRECPPPRRRVTVRQEGKWLEVSGLQIGLLTGAGSERGYSWKLLRKEDLADGEVCLVIEEGE